MKEFNRKVRERLRAVGLFQKDLVDKLNLHKKVLSRKLNGNGNARLTTGEIWLIITALAQWGAINTQDEVLHLLALAQVEPSSFSTQEWQTLPLPQSVDEETAVRLSQTGYALPHLVQYNLPAALNRLVGREEAVERLRSLLAQNEVRLVTLIGPGGSGKTRLALYVANELTQAFAQGVWLVSLASVRDAALVPQSIMQALHIKLPASTSAMQSLTTYLKSKSLLLVLDNFEQIGDAAPIVGELLAAAPALKVLVTSRVVLHLSGEHEFNVLPLAMPDANVVGNVEEIAQYGAVQLFVERARAVASDFALTNENAASVAQICARVDGLPLALELAAARIKVLLPEQLLAQLLEARLPLLTNGAKDLPDRQQTLRNTITWSYDLLSPTEQAWFIRLGVFSGGWSLAAAEAMIRAAAEGHRQKDISVTVPLLDIIGSLMDNSLLVRLPVIAGQVRFTLLETLREYALEQLDARGGAEYLRDWHASYYLGVAETAELGLRGPQQLLWRSRLVAEQDNFRAALEWSLQQARVSARMMVSVPHRRDGRDGRGAKAAKEVRTVAKNEIVSSQSPPSAGVLAVEVSLRLAAALRPYWEWHGHLDEGRVWLEAVLALPLAEGVGRTTLAAQAKALSAAAALCCLQNEQDRAIDLAETSIALWQQLDDPRGLAMARLHRGWAACAMGEYALAKGLCEQGLQLLSPKEDVWLRAQMLLYLGAVAGFTDNFAEMRSYYAQSRALFEQVGDKCAVADVLKDQGGMAILEGKYTEAVANLLQSLTMSHELGYKQFVATGMGLLGFAVGIRGEPDPVEASLQAARLWGATDGLLDTIGSNPWLNNLTVVQEMLVLIRGRVDRASWKAAWLAGKAFTEEEAFAACMALK